jgi:hypothetical protein
MPLKNENRFTCDLKPTPVEKGCDVDFYYDPGSPGAPGMPPRQPAWDVGTASALNRIVCITLPISGFTTFYCCKEHAIMALDRDQHLPPVPPKIAGATEADLNAAKRGMKVVENMKAKPS